MDLIADLQGRGLVHDHTDIEALRARLATGGMGVYVGFDPTADSLHVGHLVGQLYLRRFQMAGHRPFPLAGGATGMIGDPSGRSEERNLLDKDALRHNVECIKQQLGRLLDFEPGPYSATLVNNADWTTPLSMLEFLRDVGKYFSVNAMLAKESVKRRLESGISFTEFSYQLLQAHDFLHLHRVAGCTLQMGGSDQWGNIVAGLELIRKVTGETTYALTFPLLTKSDGSKFGKTAGGSIWLDPELTSAYEFFQYWLNTEDADIEKFLKVFSFKTRSEIENLLIEFKADPGKRTAQRELSRELTTLVHGAKNCQQAEAAAKALFGQGELKELDQTTLAAALSQLPKVALKPSELIDGKLPSWVDLMVQSGVVDSKSAARRIVKEGGAYLNNERVADEAATPQKSDLLFGRFLVLRKGKRDLAGVELI